MRSFLVSKHLVFPVPPLGYCSISFLLKCAECYGICEQFMLKQHCIVCHFSHSSFVKFTVLVLIIMLVKFYGMFVSHICKGLST